MEGVRTEVDASKEARSYEDLGNVLVKYVY